ncbi:hypothetical protein ATO10_12324 [Actibacterium atlanticum]|uniref:DUF1523 domain-containing protein n=1 Tax=Actibacterium atlanticum TaxID=1461693 RepID=A0A058ZJM3_9RHOB|nr:DUF1523 family protein [Actibacterium atlanticum]KCV81392.1 hypothetical protein ATO10_12324 [Actibacterium atlanticum]
MRYVKGTLIALIALLAIAFFHYTLPQRDVVRISDTYEKRIDFGENSIFWSSPDTGNATGTVNRDIFFIQTIQTNGKPMVYRNEDTGWGWPPYFKLDTSNLQTEAADLKSSAEAPKWVVIKHYGWRNEFLSIYPNAVGVRQVDSPDVSLFPWMNIVILTLIGLVLLFLYRLWAQFRQRAIDPLLEDAGEAWDAVDERADQARDAAKAKATGFRAWLNTWKGTPRK